ncbi:MAG: aminodeoxychorismate synthase component I [Desulfosarcinaceae bacterium]|nr:aminodeoxychorismate synthase component I [Desulfosarcinaceae bacterium]
MPNAFLRDLATIGRSFSGVTTTPIHFPHAFPTTAAPLAAQTGTVVLLSGGDLDCARHHLLAAAPWLQLEGRGQKISAVLGETRYTFEADPFWLLEQVMACLKHPKAMGNPPVSNGLFGYLAYDLKDHLEELPRTAVDPFGLPDFCLYAPSMLIVQETDQNRARLLTPIYTALAATRSEVAKGVLEAQLGSLPPPSPAYGISGEFHSRFSAATYRAAVARIRAYIAAGDVYQVNMSQCFEAPFTGDPYALFLDLFDANPAPFFAFVQAGDHQVVSTSPERYLLLQGNAVETRPIKGTRPRSSDPVQDAALRTELTASPKDDAELSMIVDLLRNDIGRVCAGGSVRVSEHKRVEAYTNVYHLVSIVEGELEAGKDAIDLLRATFPGGSITGCPKIRAMEIIDELEPTRRHVYTGAMGYIGFDETMDLSIAIRTATISDGQIRFSVGGGVVFDSDPQAEYEETLHKGRTLMGALAGSDQVAVPRGAGGHAWMNGLLMPVQDARLPIDDLGVQYGHGFFETIRIHQGEPHNLSAHLERWRRSWNTLFEVPSPDLSWALIIGQLLDANGLSGAEAAVKLMATYGSPGRKPQRPNIVATARPYRHRLADLGRSGLRLGTFPAPIASPLLAHKSLNYLFFHLAGQWAATQGVEEALILDCDGRVSETNTASLLVLDGKRVIRPASHGALPGTMQAAVMDRFRAWGYAVDARPLYPTDLIHAGGVMATNALMGPVPVVAVDGEAIEPCTALCRQLHQAVGLGEASFF